MRGTGRSSEVPYITRDEFLMGLRAERDAKDDA